MTQTQFVGYGARGFWAYDVSLGIFLKHLVDVAEIADVGAHAKWLAAAITDWRLVACVSDYGLTIEEDWSSDQLDTFVRLTDEACARLGQRDLIPLEEIAAWQIHEGRGIFLRGATKIQTWPIVDLGRAIRALVVGSLPNAPPGTIWFYGTPSGRGTIRGRPLP